MSQKTKTSYIDQVWVKIGLNVELLTSTDKVDFVVLSDITVVSTTIKQNHRKQCVKLIPLQAKSVFVLR